MPEVAEEMIEPVVQDEPVSESTEEPAWNEWDGYDLARCTDVAYIQDARFGDHVILTGVTDEHGNSPVKVFTGSGRAWQEAWRMARQQAEG